MFCLPWAQSNRCILKMLVFCWKTPETCYMNPKHVSCLFKLIVASVKEAYTDTKCMPLKWWYTVWEKRMEEAIAETNAKKHLSRRRMSSQWEVRTTHQEDSFPLPSLLSEGTHNFAMVFVSLSAILRTVLQGKLILLCLVTSSHWQGLLSEDFNANTADKAFLTSDHGLLFVLQITQR